MYRAQPWCKPAKGALWNRPGYRGLCPDTEHKGTPTCPCFKYVLHCRWEPRWEPSLMSTAR